MKTNMTIRLFLSLLITCSLIGVLLVGCGSSNNAMGLTGDGSVTLDFSIPVSASISDFDWFFVSSSYDKSGEVAFTPANNDMNYNGAIAISRKIN